MMNQVLQSVLTYLVLTGAVVYIFISLYRTLGKKATQPGECGGGCGCDAAEIKKKLQEKGNR